MNTKSCWKIIETELGISITYVNMVDGIQFDCGVCRSDTPFSMLLDFITGEGAPGDVVVFNGRPLYHLMKQPRTPQ